MAMETACINLAVRGRPEAPMWDFSTIFLTCGINATHQRKITSAIG